MKMKLPDALCLSGNTENGGQTKNPNDFLRGMDAAVLAFLRMIAVFFGIKLKEDKNNSDDNGSFIPKSCRKKRKYRIYHMSSKSVSGIPVINSSAEPYFTVLARQRVFTQRLFV